MNRVFIKDNKLVVNTFGEINNDNKVSVKFSDDDMFEISGKDVSTLLQLLNNVVIKKEVHNISNNTVKYESSVLNDENKDDEIFRLTEELNKMQNKYNDLRNENLNIKLKLYDFIKKINSDIKEFNMSRRFYERMMKLNIDFDKIFNFSYHKEGIIDEKGNKKVLNEHYYIK